DYVVVKWPRFAFEKFPGSNPRLGTQMKSVGEAMSIGRTFSEALQKAARSLETGKDGMTSLLGRVDYRQVDEQPSPGRDLALDAPPEYRPKPTLPPADPVALREALLARIAVPTAERLFYVFDALRVGITPEE